MILLYIYNIMTSISLKNFYEDIQDTIIRKYQNKEFEEIDLKKKPLLININFHPSKSWWREKFIAEGEQTILNSVKFNFVLDSDNNIMITYGENKTCSFTEFLDENFRDRVIDYEIIYNLSAYPIVRTEEKIVETFIKNIKEYHKNHTIRILRDCDLLFHFFGRTLKSSDFVYNGDNIIINFIFKRKDSLYYFIINFEEFNIRKYFTDILIDYEFTKLSDKDLLSRLFENFKCSSYTMFFNNTMNIQEGFIKNTSIKESEKNNNSSLFDNNFPYVFNEDNLSIDGKLYISGSLDKRNISKEMFEDMKEFFSSSLNLKNEDLFSASLLYYSLTDDMKLLIINKIMKSYYSSYSIIFLHLLKSLKIITNNEFEDIMNLSYSLRIVDQDKKDALEIAYDNLFDEIIKKRILKIRPIPKFSHFNYLTILFGKVLNEVYLSNDYKTEEYHWKGLYDEILNKLDIPKDANSAFNIFKYVMKDLKDVTYILDYELASTFNILAHLTKRFPPISRNNVIYFKSQDNKKILIKENLQDLPLKYELSEIIN